MLLSRGIKKLLILSSLLQCNWAHTNSQRSQCLHAKKTSPCLTLRLYFLSFTTSREHNNSIWPLWSWRRKIGNLIKSSRLGSAKPTEHLNMRQELLHEAAARTTQGREATQAAESRASTCFSTLRTSGNSELRAMTRSRLRPPKLKMSWLCRDPHIRTSAMDNQCHYRPVRQLVH